MKPVYKREGCLYVKKGNEGRQNRLKISGPFETPAKVSRPCAGDRYGLLVTFSDDQERRKHIIVSASELVRSARDVCATLVDRGLYVDRNHAEEFVSYLQRQMEQAPAADLADRPGWATEEVYVLVDGTKIGAQSSGRALYYSGDVTDRSVKGTLAEWQAEVASPCMENSRLVTSICSALAGVLLRDTSEQSGGLHFVGPSSIGKTTQLHVAASAIGVNLATWRTTANGHEPLMANANDGTVLLDEIGQSDGRNLVEMIYAAANGQGKRRMRKDQRAAESMSWRVFLLSTGESTIETHARNAGGRAPGGAAIRLLDIPADAGCGLGVFENLHGEESAGQFADKLKSAASKFHGTGLPHFVEHLLEFSPDERRQLIFERRDAFLALCGLSKAGAEVGRAAKRAALVAAAGELAIALKILPWPTGHANESLLKCLNAWRDARGGDSDGHDEMRAVAQIREFIEQHGASRFEAIEHATTPSPPIRNRAGFRRASHAGMEYLFLRETFRTEVCRGFDYRAVLAALDKSGHLLREEKALTRSTNTPIGKIRVVCVRSSILEGQ